MAILKDGKYYLKHIYNCWYYLYLFRIFYNKPNVISVQTINPNYFHQNNFFDEVMIVLHIFDSKSEHTCFTLQVSLPAFTQIFYCILRHTPGLQSTSHYQAIQSNRSTAFVLCLLFSFSSGQCYNNFLDYYFQILLDYCEAYI